MSINSNSIRLFHKVQATIQNFAISKWEKIDKATSNKFLKENCEQLRYLFQWYRTYTPKKSNHPAIPLPPYCGGVKIWAHDLGPGTTFHQQYARGEEIIEDRCNNSRARKYPRRLVREEYPPRT